MQDLLKDISQPAICYDKLVKQVKDVCISCNRNFEDVHILPVVKYASVNQIVNLLRYKKIDYVAESRLQDSIKKWQSAELSGFNVKKVFIGHLQKNKVAKIIAFFDLIASLDSLEMAKFINEKAILQNKKVSCLLQIKLTNKDTQGGVSLQNAQTLLTQIKETCPFINLKGLMAIAPQADDETIKSLFREVKKVFVSNFSTSQDILSMGMSNDYKLAIQEGSNLIRIGSAIFDCTEGVNDN